MTKTKVNEDIVCDVLGCGQKSTYRLTFDGKSSVFICKDCFNEFKNFVKKDGGGHENAA